MKAPKSYIEFMKEFGFVEFDDEIDCRFGFVADDMYDFINNPRPFDELE